MKTILIILFFLFIRVNAQEIQRLNELGYPTKEETALENDFIEGEIIVKFKEGIYKYSSNRE